MDSPTVIFAALGILGIFLSIFLYSRNRLLQKEMLRTEAEANRQLYELSVLKELERKMSYSLDIQNVVDVIISSLHHFLEYSTVSYMVFDNGNVVFRTHAEESLPREFIDEIKKRMADSLGALLGEDLERKYHIIEILTGASLSSERTKHVRSFFNIPLVVGDRVSGVLTVAHFKEGLYKEDEMTILYTIVKQASHAITQLREVVAAEKEKLNAMVQSMKEGVIMTDKDYQVIIVNPSAKKSIGFGANEEITIVDLIDRLGRAFPIRERLYESMRLGVDVVENDVLIGDRFYQVLISPVKGTEGSQRGNILGGVVIFHDTTHEKDVERIRDTFTSMMVHELRTPLGNIRKTMELILKEGLEKKVKEYADYFHMTYQSTFEMLEWVNDLLDITKIEAGKFEILKQPSNVRAVVAERLSFFDAVSKNGNVKLSSQFSRAIPRQILFDPHRIGQVITNLVSNAFKFTPRGGEIAVQIFFHKKKEIIDEEAKEASLLWRQNGSAEKTTEIPDSLVIAVTDSGVGIAKENIPLLFNRFQQIKTRASQANKEGTGLGLAISKGITEAHGGIMGVRSQEGVGSTFYFTLPLESDGSSSQLSKKLPHQE